MDQINSLKTEHRFKKTEIGDIPVDWEVVNIKEVCQNPEYGFTTSAKEEPIGPKLLRITDIQNGDVNWRNVPYCNCPNSLKKRFILKEGDILFARTGATTGKSYIIRECPEAIFASYLIRLRTKEIIESIFLYYLFNSSIYWKQIKQQIGGSAQGGVNATLLSNIKIPLPPLSEQKKIAEVLSTVDEAVEKKKSIIEKIKELKKGLMQELLTRGTGHKKFKKTELGEIPEDWEILRIGEICNVRRGASPRPIGDSKYFGGGPGWIRISDVTKSNNYLRETKDHLSELGVSKSVRVKPGDLIMSICATIGKPVIVDMDACIHDGFVLFDRLSNEVNSLFLLYWLQKNETFFASQGQHGTQGNLNTTIIKNTKVPLPPLQEQKNIAKILAYWDDKIEKEINYAEMLETTKTGLMQMLLTGKLRIKL